VPAFNPLGVQIWSKLWRNQFKQFLRPFHRMLS
jgi:hypothetical protein